MMNRTIAIALSLWLAAFGVAAAVDGATIERRIADAVEIYEKQGVGTLCAAATDADGPFLVDEAYVFVFFRDGQLICHPRPDLNAMRRDRTHVPRILENAATAPNGAWTRYIWPHPETFELGLKSTFCRNTGQVVICAGAFLDIGSV